MDVSQEYILMCQKATEIQEYWQENQVEDGDFYAKSPYSDGDMNNVRIHKKFSGILYDIICESNFVWLPRQDQLQEMIGIYPKPFALFSFFNKKDYTTDKYIRISLNMKKPQYPINIFNSFEQLWLVFVMKEKYNKKWNGKTWEKIK